MKNSINDESLTYQNRQSLKNMYFTRFLLIRYSAAFLFFFNLLFLMIYLQTRSFWMIVPLIVLAIQFVSIVELTKMYNAPTSDLPWTTYSFIASLVTLLGSLILTQTQLSATLLPFMKNTQENKNVVSLIIIALVCFILFLLKKLTVIKNDKDKQYFRIKKYENLLTKGK